MNKIEKIAKNTIFDPEKYDRYGVENALAFQKKPIKRYAERQLHGGEIVTREGEAHFHQGDWIVTDEQGGKYPVSDKKFRVSYNVPEGAVRGWFERVPVKVMLFRTNKELHIPTKWGNYTASKGDWIELLENGCLGCPIKPDAVRSGYDLL